MNAYAIDGYGDLSTLRLRDLPRPSPGPRELLVKVRAAALNPADLKVASGKDGGRFLHAGRFPLTLGFDFSGTVEALGAGVSGRAVGDEVFGFLPYSRSNRSGSFADYLVCAASAVGCKPANLSHEEAAASATTGVTALQALRDKGRLSRGQSVLINGASGGVGTYAVQIAHALGATVVATASAAKAGSVTALGALRVYDYKKTRLADIEERFDMVFDVIANASYGDCAKLLKPHGSFISLLPSSRVFLGMARALFSSHRCAFLMASPRSADFDQLARWMSEGKVKPSVDRACPLAELPAALERLRSGEVRGKLAVTVSAG